ncbi:hypothetical protein ONZ45_g18187 [Pleurotus djamor]|nr:hypothetical protein ONZ45_g18187 [Pleurotus djamor]
MDAISQLQETEIAKVLVPTVIAFAPLLEAKRSLIQSIPKETYTYGSTERHQLDVYYPNLSTTSTAPILFFIYGGGFTAGERTLPPPADLAYANVAAYFALQGFITVIPDYRLVPHVKFPGQAEDVRDAVHWVVENLNAQSHTVEVPHADTNNVFLMGHSAGAYNASLTMLYPDMTPPELKNHVKGLVLISGPYHRFPSGKKADFNELIGVYWVDEDQTKKYDPLPLLKGLSDVETAEFPPMLLIEGSREPEWLRVVGKDFHEEAKSKAARARARLQVEKVIAEGHNHISISFALLSGEGEEWAEKSVEWIGSIVRASS